MDILNLLVTLIGGAVGGNVAGPATQDKDLGVLGNTISGIVGGTAGAYIMQILGILGATAGATSTPGLESIDWSSILATLGVSGGSGAVVTAIVAYIKSAMQK